MAPGPIKGPSACRPALAPPFPPAPPAPHGPIPSAPMAPMAHGSWPHGQQWLHGPIFSDLKRPSAPPSLAPWPQPHAPRSPYASTPDQMTLKGPSACPPAPPAPLAPPFPRSIRPPWPSTPMAPNPCLRGPMAPGAMAPNISMLRLRRPTPYFVAPGPMAPCPGPMPLDPIK